MCTVVTAINKQKSSKSTEQAKINPFRQLIYPRVMEILRTIFKPMTLPNDIRARRLFIL